MAHRGPDDEHVISDGPVTLGARRLAVIDPSAAGRQPMRSADGRYLIVYNGEIYNYAELRPWLEQRGHRFASRTDTEVIVHLYEELGADCVTALKGMFAFAIWDERARRLMLARDRLGKKPLYYSFDGRSVVFGSEAKALLRHPSVNAVPDPGGIDQYLSLGYLLGAQSTFSGINKLPPAHYLIFEDARVRVQRYWALDSLSAETMQPIFGDLQSIPALLFRDRLRELPRVERIGPMAGDERER